MKRSIVWLIVFHALFEVKESFFLVKRRSLNSKYVASPVSQNEIPGLDKTGERGLP